MLLKLLWIALFSCSLLAKDKLSIVSPHRKSIQKELIPLFEETYKAKYGTEVEVDWIDQGGTENDLRFIINRFDKNPKTSSIDVFWGGGEVTFYDLEGRGLLSPYQLPPELDKLLPQKLGSLNFRSDHNNWYATALSSFGIFYNKRVLSLLKKPEPSTWLDLGKKEYFEQVSVADPRQSSSSLMMFLIMLGAQGWDKGWGLFNALAGNTRKFTHSSSDPIKAVLTGEAALATAINFYASPKVASIGHKNLGFALPKKATIFNSDPVAILKGAPNRKVAERFVEFTLSQRAQEILIYPQGHEKGPQYSTLGRIAVIPKVYEEKSAKELELANPFGDESALNLDMKDIVETKKIVSELIGTIHVDLHHDLTAAWKHLIDHPDPEKEKLFLTPLVSKKEMESCKEKWDDPLFRTETKNEWMKRAQNRYEKILEEDSDGSNDNSSSFFKFLFASLDGRG